jgi:hypothetical protein
MSEKTVGLLASVPSIKAVRQELVDKLHDLPPKRWKIGIEVRNRRGEGPSLFFVRRTASCISVTLGSSGDEIAKIKLNPDRNDGLQSAYNYEQMEQLIEKLLGNPEAATILRQL